MYAFGLTSARRILSANKCNLPMSIIELENINDIILLGHKENVHLYSKDSFVYAYRLNVKMIVQITFMHLHSCVYIVWSFIRKCVYIIICTCIYVYTKYEFAISKS